MEQNIPMSRYIISKLKGSNRIVLTFDATYGDEYTDKILDVLEKYHIHATFFLSGIWTEKYHAHIQRMEELNCEIGNHSYDHPHFSELDFEAMKEQIERTQALNEKYAIRASKYFRFPFGQINRDAISYLLSRGFIPVEWSLDTLDWKNNKEKSLSLIRKVKPGNIVLMHNGGEFTAEIVETLLCESQNNGSLSRFCNLTEALKETPCFITPPKAGTI